MDIGLNIADGVRVRIGDDLDKITESMNENNVSYKIPYKNKTGSDASIIMFMESCEVEINVSNNVIIYIKCNNSESNHVMQIKNGTRPIDALFEIKKNIAKAFDIKDSDIRIDRFDWQTLNSTLSIPISGSKKAKIELVMGTNQNIYMHSISLIT